MLKRSRILWLVGAAAVVTAGVAWMARPRATEVDVASVTRGMLRVTIDEEGTTRVRDHQDVSAPVTGRFVPSGVRVGDRVARGALLGAIHAVPFDAEALAQARAREGMARAAVQEASARLTSAQAALEEGQNLAARRERLAAAGGASGEEVERARTAVVALTQERDAARIRVEAAGFELESARTALVLRSGSAGRGQDVTRSWDVRAPLAGVVLRLAEEHERVLAAGTLLAQVGNPSGLEVVVPLLTADAARVKPGFGMRITIGPGTDTLLARVVVVEPAAFKRLSPLGVEEQRVNVIGRLDSSATSLGDAFRVDARITVLEVPDALIVPSSALVRHGQEWSVFVVSGGRAARRVVSIGARGDDAAQVISGLGTGDRVVVYPGEALRDGARVATATR
jgi:HlyD family secretion protein